MSQQLKNRSIDSRSTSFCLGSICTGYRTYSLVAAGFSIPCLVPIFVVGVVGVFLFVAAAGIRQPLFAGPGLVAE